MRVKEKIIHAKEVHTGIKKLTNLDLSFNELSGPIPKEIGELSNLSELFIINKT